jgi:hypothetical protein
MKGLAQLGGSPDAGKSSRSPEPSDDWWRAGRGAGELIEGQLGSSWVRNAIMKDENATQLTREA